MDAVGSTKKRQDNDTHLRGQRKMDLAIKRKNLTRRTRIMSLKFCVLLISIFLTIKAANALYEASSSYDPEQQDGIPVLSARSLRPQPADDWLNHDDEIDQQAASVNDRLATQRRNSDSDLDDDDEDDEFQSGSSNHEHIEPNYGESQRSARDADDIESFFDRHLGPPGDLGDSRVAEASSDTPIYSEMPVNRDDHSTEDMYKTAASGPLTTIFQSLFGANRKPLVIHAHSADPEPAIITETAASSSTTADEATKGAKATVSKTASSLPATVAVPNPSGSMLRAAGHRVESVAPFAYLMPIAQSSSGYESHAADPSSGEEERPVEDDQQGIREIYIGRRPHIASILQQQAYGSAVDQQHYRQPYATSDGLSSAAGSAQVWRGSAMSPGRQYIGQPKHYATMSQQQQYDDQSSAGGDYARYPIAASYAHQREQPSASADSADDGQTVTYGLSLGGSADQGDEGSPVGEGASAAPEESGQSEQQDDSQQQAGGAEQQAYVPYSARDLMRYRAASSQAYNNYPAGGAQYGQLMQQQQQAAAMNALMMRRYRQQQLAQQQQQQPYHGSRYHRDPSETSTTSSYGPGSYRGQQYANSNNRAAMVAATLRRQQLLADLDKQIRASPLYGKNAARPDKQMTSQSTIRSGFLNSDLDTYDSYHSEMDPYKTFTRSSKMIRYPAQLRRNHNRQHYHNNQYRPTEISADRTNADTNNSPHHSSQLTSADHSDQTQQQQQSAERPQNEVDASGNNLSSSADSSLVNQTNSVKGNTDAQAAPLATGPLVNYDSSTQDHTQDLLRNQISAQTGDQPGGSNSNGQQQTNLRVRRDDSDDRDSDDADDDDGVWVDDNDDDDNKQQSSDVNETSQEPEDEAGDQEDEASTNAGNRLTNSQFNPPGVIGRPHGFDLSPQDLMIYPS